MFLPKDSEVQDLMVGSTKETISFWSLSYMQISTYVVPNIHRVEPAG
jgi:hypothetical protein